MATLLAMLTSGRKDGFTAQLMEAALAGARTVKGLKVELVHSHDFRFSPCTGCFACVRGDEHVCVLDDDMGREGKGELFRRLGEANGLLIADPVHNWSPSASARLLIERCYPFLWSGALNGMPAATLSCASNQGMHMVANRELCKWVFGLRMRYHGGLAVHVARLEQSFAEARDLGKRLGMAAMRDGADGRRAWTDEEAFVHYALHAPWSPLQPYIENLTAGAMLAERSEMAWALQNETFRNPEAVEHLRRAQDEFRRTVTLYQLGETEDAARSLVAASAHWTRATWKEFLEEEVIGAPQPEAYRPLPE